MSKIGLLGGSFDPIHLGHTKVIKEAIRQLELDCFYVIPTANNPWKEKNIASKKQRLKMIDIALKDIPNASVHTIEMEQDSNQKNYTIDTLLTLTKQQPDDEFYFIMGMDQASKFHLWKEAKRISELVQLVTFDRLGYKANENIDIYHFLHLEHSSCINSSTRFRAGALDDIAPLVAKYAFNQGLYLDTIIQDKMSEKRYLHTLSVAKVAKEIAISNGIDGTKAYIAGMLHDIAKEMGIDQARIIIETQYPNHLDAPIPIWHQWISEYEAKTIYYIEDLEILQAIRHHTTASIHMSPLDMCIYVADKYDPLRDFDSSQEIEVCKQDIVVGFIQCLKDSYEFMKENNRVIDTHFMNVYHTYIEENIHE